MAKIMTFCREEFWGCIHLIQLNSKDLSWRVFGKHALENIIFTTIELSPFSSSHFYSLVNSLQLRKKPSCDTEAHLLSHCCANAHIITCLFVLLQVLVGSMQIRNVVKVL